MYSDNTLLPREAVRLAALGILMQRPVAYGALARETRHFTSRYWGATTEVMANSIELLRVEGLIAATAPGEDPVMAVTEAGREEFRRLMDANIRIPASDFNKLVVALKVRFLHLLAPAEQEAQIEVLVERFTAELARLEDAERAYGAEPGAIGAWLARDIARARADVAWCRTLQARLSGTVEEAAGAPQA